MQVFFTHSPNLITLRYLVAGLGNIGDEYSGTRHNIGFSVIDHIVQRENLSFRSDRLAFVSEWRHKGRFIVLIKPTTFMNLSGKAINYWLQKENISLENLIVLVDDLAIPFGSIRIKIKGSDGGHNGLANINETLKGLPYNRIRFGIGSEYAKGKQVDYVLGKWTEEESKLLPDRIEKVYEAVKSFVSIGIDRTMNLYNNK